MIINTLIRYNIQPIIDEKNGQGTIRGSTKLEINQHEDKDN